MIFRKVKNPILRSILRVRPAGIGGRLLCLLLLLLSSAVLVSAGPEIATSDDNKTVIVQDAPEQEVYVFGKSIVVKKNAKGVLAVGGDVYIEGNVEGDVATIGGNVIQREGGRVGGDVIIFGGAYKPDSQNPLREPGKQTLVIGVFEEEFRDLAQDPSQLLAPAFTWAFLAQRLLLTLFWFVISIVLTTIAPGAVGRAVARVKLSKLKVAAFGSVAFVLTLVAIVGSVSVLPDFLSVTFGLMGLALLFFGYVFGRVTLQVSFGKFIQKHILSEKNRSETLATLLGVVTWTMLLSIPYFWLAALFAVFAVGIGLILTARSQTSWQKP